jgi:hypothetical protein
MLETYRTAFSTARTVWPTSIQTTVCEPLQTHRGHSAPATHGARRELAFRALVCPGQLAVGGRIDICTHGQMLP